MSLQKADSKQSSKGTGISQLDRSQHEIQSNGHANLQPPGFKKFDSQKVLLAGGVAIADESSNKFVATPINAKVPSMNEASVMKRHISQNLAQAGATAVEEGTNTLEHTDHLDGSAMRFDENGGAVRVSQELLGSSKDHRNEPPKVVFDVNAYQDQMVSDDERDYMLDNNESVKELRENRYRMQQRKLK